MLTVSDDFREFFTSKFGQFMHLFRDDEEQEAYEKQYQQEAPSNPNYFIYDGTNLGLLHFEVVSILDKHFHYYRNLNEPLKHEFYNRVFRFMHSKQFVIHSNEPYKEMPVLISAAAVQISFGLEHFELDHYDYIQIHKEEYFAQNSLRVLAGNVQGNCITLAWNQFVKGNVDITDGSNVGLHEMAHALYFQEMIVDCEGSTFEYHFNELMYEGEEVLQQKKCPHNLYSEYAFSNLQEFWAVSVELFFERTKDLENSYPKVFETLQNILKQNPIKTQNPLLN